MQTFLPSRSFVESARLLDKQRLLKRYVEAEQILRAVCHESYGRQTHPAVEMWRGYAPALVAYRNARPRKT